jgi:hypothetical protein
MRQQQITNFFKPTRRSQGNSIDPIPARCDNRSRSPIDSIPEHSDDGSLYSIPARCDDRSRGRIRSPIDSIPARCDDRGRSRSPIDSFPARCEDRDDDDAMLKKAKKKAYNAAYHQANKPERNAQKKAYRDANKEKIAAQNKANYEANKPERLARDKAYRAANKEEIAAQKKVYRAATKEETRLTRIAEHQAYLEENGCKHRILTPEEVQDECDKIVNKKRAELGGRSILEAFKAAKDAMYFGMTKLTDIHDEAYRWLTQLSDNRPVLLWKDARDGRDKQGKPTTRQHV